MIRPVNFGYNAETAVNNAFQQQVTTNDINEKAQQEFDELVSLLRKNDIDVIVYQDEPNPYTPDSVFPNNWFSTHADGSVFLYPMFAPNRRLERNDQVLYLLNETFAIRIVNDLSFYEGQNIFLEGTGSMILDRENDIAYACLSPRTNVTVLYDFCEQLGYAPVLFNAVDESGNEIYHTNVMMCVANNYVIICMEAIKDGVQKQMLYQKFKETEKKAIEITIEQMNHFAGNMLQVNNSKGENFLVMSSQAYNSLTASQIDDIKSFNNIIHSNVSAIETAGGGSVRCMMAEVFLPERPA